MNSILTHFRAVIFTDFFQIIIMFTGMVLVIIFGTNNVGGFKELWIIR